MTTDPTFEEIVAQHQTEIVDDFLVKNLHAECSCGECVKKINAAILGGGE